MKWTLDSNNPVGPIQVNRFNKAIGKFRSEHNTGKEKWGVIGGEEHEMSFVSIFGGGSREDVTKASNEIGERYGWTVSKANVNQIIADIEAAMPALIAARPVKDKRITMEAHLAEEEANRVEAQQQAERNERFKGTAPEFQAQIKRIAKVGNRTVEWVYKLWCEYAKANHDMSCIVSEFCEWNYEKLGASVTALLKAIETPEPLGTVKRNYQHDGVEIAFNEKPSDSLRYQLQRAGFRITRRPPWKWYQKFSQVAWDKACELAGVSQTAPSVQEPEADPVGDMDTAHEAAYEDAQAAMIGA